VPPDDEQTNGATGAEGALTSEQRAEAGRVADLQKERAKRQELEGKLAALEAAGLGKVSRLPRSIRASNRCIARAPASFMSMCG
jgi:hypothetical protein